MPVPPKIAVVGASARATAFSLLRAGCEVVAADLFADADLTRACQVTRITNYPEGLADWVAETRCDGWLYTGALENHPDLIDRMARLRPLLGNKGDVLRTVRDTMLLQEWCGQLGFNFPGTKPCDGTQPGEGEWLHKTGQGGNGSGVTRASEPAGLSPRSSGFYQRHISGTPGSTIYLGDGINTCTLLGITHQLIGQYPPPRYPGEGLGEGHLTSGNGEVYDSTTQPSPCIQSTLASRNSGRGINNFQYCGTLAPWELPTNAKADLIRLGRVLSTQYSLRGVFGIDFIFDGERVWLIEVNPRVTAAVEVVERVTGNNLLAEHLAAFKIPSDPLRQIAKPAAGKFILYAKQPLTISRRLSEKLLTDAGPRQSPQLADIPNPDTTIAVGEPILTMLADGTDIATVERELRERVAALENELYRG